MPSLEDKIALICTSKSRYYYFFFILTYFSNIGFTKRAVFYVVNSVRDILSQAVQTATLLYVFKFIGKFCDLPLCVS